MSTADGPRAAAPCQPSSSVESSGCMEPDPDHELLFPVTRSFLLARRLLNLQAYRCHVTRRKREMMPTDKKDSSYWDKRRKNNQAAKRSREKRRLSDMMQEGQLLALSEENAQLRAQVLSLQYHGSLSAEKSKAACATSTASVSTLPASPRPAIFQPGLWGNSRSNASSVLSARQQQTDSHLFEANVPYFSFTPQSLHNRGTQKGIFPLSGPRVLSPRAVLEGGRSVEAEMDAQRQVSSSDDIHNSTDASSIRAFLPTPDTLHHASILSPGNWLMPHLNHPAVCNTFLLPWRSSYLAPPAVYPGMPLYIQERQGQSVGVEADIQLGGFKSRFSRAPAGLSQLGMHLSPDGR
ncbi:uncharacterized protein LOC115007233 [Cottoperca gobio]|uniref:Uncharacterized protein LOC115007233 n=1 Tax=Cottoperca gobio TaxID=56716 RepID=A0A6J2PL90_COTGO|nr:uncharacterized protein LOC115007233 [Cottoperca gobio]XP_029285867.1 uncharacterized protein LOC115007233 [Cottoperca gobio]XP_029285868.1 uncharacterized protein LOC115007233 [Cottoperca gobio]XP_029285869.1 uncharacterized protein LOC115007233 [Cottoperca gobio]XP_029285870.1 uncharacterized protein LOC115007233 [Cottoperca gobio]XP_029285871.1 uncharacterized protein LOC115007233 [Cottoperca gobio]